jgi:signal transduction histidine kinase
VETINQLDGLNYQCYEGWWNEVPDFRGLKPLKTGTVDNFNLEVRTRDEGVGLHFYGFFVTPHDGTYTFFLNSDDGSRLSIGLPDVELKILGNDPLPAPHKLFVGQILDMTMSDTWGQFEGKVTKVWLADGGFRMELSVGSAHLEVVFTGKTAMPEFLEPNSLVRVTGFCQAARNVQGLKVPGRLLLADIKQIELVSRPTSAAVASTNNTGLPLLTTAVEIHRLKRSEAQREYPAIIRGVVTSIDPSGLGITIQDTTGGLYAQGPINVRVGEFVEAEGVTDPGDFAPLLKLHRITCLGEGLMPEPTLPAWDQLLNGSLDAQYVEIEGIVTSVTANDVQILTHGGLITAELQDGVSEAELGNYQNKLVQIRGVLLANWNGQSHQVLLGVFRIFTPNITVETSMPTDVFSSPLKTPTDLLLFDPEAGLFQPVRMSGQIVHVGEDICYMMSGTNGVRFVPNSQVTLQAGDTVVVAGYPQLGGDSPLLRDVSVHKTGWSKLPEARRLSSGNVANANYDSTRVRVDGVLTGISDASTNQFLEIQNGSQNFVAQLNGAQAYLSSLPIGCHLELTGVYSVESGNHALARPVSSFDLLLDSSADIKILARPPWWTLRRLLITMGLLACVLIAALIWITQLHRKVDARTIQLQAQIEKRQRAEQHRAMEQERARIAQDLHDELGSGLTEVSMLAAVTDTAVSNQLLEQIADRSRNMVSALDEIVWAMNPKHDSLQSLGSYFCLYADRFLKPANINCRLIGTLNLPEQALNPIHRNDFFLAFKEALTNVVRHSGASEVRLNFCIIGNRLRVSLADNGTGLQPKGPTTEMDGLANMQRRLEKVGGRFAIVSQAGRGTTLRFYIPLN